MQEDISTSPPLGRGATGGREADAQPGGPGDGRPTKLLAAIFASLVTAGTALLGVLGTPEGLWIVGQAAAYVLLFLGLTQVANSALRWHLGHPRLKKLGKRLWLELGLCGGVPLAVGGVVVAADPVSWATLALAVPVGAVCLVADLLESAIARIVRRGGLISVTDYVAGCKALGRIGGEEGMSFADAVRDALPAPLARFAIFLLETPLAQWMSRTRVLITSVLLFAALALGGSAVARIGLDAMHDHFHPHPHVSTPHRHRKAGPKRSSLAQQRGTGLGPTTTAAPATAAAPAPTPSPAEADWDKICPSLPGAGAPAWAPWAAADLYALYLGSPGGTTHLHANPPPGAVAGCTGPVVGWSPLDRFVYTIGTDPTTGLLRSVAVDSLRFPAALFLAPAARPVLRLIRRYDVLGGSPRIGVGAGDCYLVWVPPSGTVVLVRAQYQQRLHPKLAQPYTQLPIGVADAWMDAMGEAKHWLWPLERVHADGTATFLLVDDVVAKHVRGRIDYRFDTRIAQRRIGAAVRSYGPDGTEISEDALRTLAATAR